MADDQSNLIPLYALDRVCADRFLRTDLNMLAKHGAIHMSVVKDRAGDLPALDAQTVQQLINKGSITLRASIDEAAWQFVGGYDHFMQKYGLKPKEPL